LGEGGVLEALKFSILSLLATEPAKAFTFQPFGLQALKLHDGRKAEVNGWRDLPQFPEDFFSERSCRLVCLHKVDPLLA
jgi:hypothetical protein